MLVGSLQFIGLMPLLLLGVLSVVVACRVARLRFFRLLRRVRYLLLTIFILFAFFTPGEALLHGFPALSPTREGLTLALEHGLRLVPVVALVAVLLASVPSERLIGGLYALSRPFALIGASPERLAVRLMLVLGHVDAPVSRSWRDWLLDDGSDDAGAPVKLVRERLGWRDALALVMAALALMLVLLR